MDVEVRRQPIVRGGVAAAACLVVWNVAGPACRVAEAGVVRLALALGGVRSNQVGEQLVVHRNATEAFVASIGPWCSALGPVLAFVVMGAMAPSTARRRCVMVASVAVVLANIVRLVGVVAIGAIGDTAELEQWHDGAGVVLAVGVLFVAFGWLLSRLWPMPGRASVAVSR